ncbi:MAG: gliding motility-associated C-terminal domain-containing protein [Chitinophagales bacterium]
MALMIPGAHAQQSIQLYYEDFNGGTPGFTLNTPTSISSATGPNQWIINANYTGGGLYPDTPDETQTQGGTIAGAPYSNYLHIHDSNNSATCTNANYDPNSASDQMAIMNTSFCTLGLTDVTLTFFYIGEGDVNDNLRLYYSLDGGSSWIQTGQSAYYGQNLWKYEIVTDPAFNNQLDVRFGWRWVNGTGAATSIGFGVDDIIVVGTYDDINSPVTMSITSVSPNPVCQGGYLFISWELSAPLCEGTYDVQLSNSSGNFGSYTDLGVFVIGAQQTAGSIAVIIPSNTPAGTCYEVRITRVSPAPIISFTASVCFEVEVCPNVITTLQPVITYGPDTVCVQSKIDVPFYSTGVYNFNNQYVAELSDASGNFSTPTTIGTSLDANTYDPMYGSLPGTVSGIVPDVPDGCGYMIRVSSTNPVATGSPWGPFCLHHCDATTNNLEDISVCITDNVGVDTLISVDVNTWNNNTTYLPGNEFQVQVLSSMTYQILNTGSLGSVASQSSTTLTLSIPGLNQLIGILGAPGVGLYYMRLIATLPDPSWNNLGTLVHLTIGSPDSIPPTITPDDTIVCNSVISGITINPFDYNSQYQWYSPGFNNNQPFIWDYNPLLINWTGAPVGTYWFTVREFNYGCWGPWSDTIYIDVIGTPSSSIIGPVTACIGDTITYTTTFLAGTYYEWDGSLLNIVDTANNEITVAFDSAGTATLDIFALNECGSNSGTKTIIVHDAPDVVAPPDTNICPGTQLTLNAVTNGTAFIWSVNGQSIGITNPIYVAPGDTTLYVITVLNSFNCDKSDSTLVTVYPKVSGTVDSMDVSCFGAVDGSAVAISLSGVPPYQYEWNTVPPQTTAFITDLSAGFYMVYITDANGCMDTASTYINEPQSMVISITSTPESEWHANDATATVFISGGTEPYIYEWSTTPTQYLSTATNLAPGTYTVTITDSNGCKISDTVTIEEAQNIFAVPNAFTPNGDGVNDEFLPNQQNLATMDMKIYNRWGQLVFFTTDPHVGWNGTYNGAEEEIGTYVYLITATFLDGNAAQQTGNVTLLR